MAEQPLLQVLPEFYANVVNFGGTAFDIRLVFGQIIKREEQEEFEPRVAITLPWLQAKALSIYLQLNLFAYEKVNGKIDIPSHLLPSIQPPSPDMTDPASKEVAENLYKKLQQILATLSDLDPS